MVIDSLNGFINSMPDEQFLPSQLHELISYMNQQGVVTLLVLAQHGLIASELMSVVDVSYLADAVVLIRFFESDAKLRLAISVVKNRSGNHEKSVREMVMNGGIKIGKPLTASHGVLNGVTEVAAASSTSSYTPNNGD
jgi:circadian clock protein KaiC